MAKGTDLLEIVGFQGIDLHLGLLVLAGYSFVALTQHLPNSCKQKGQPSIQTAALFNEY
jgi:hypothetical protein